MINPDFPFGFKYQINKVQNTFSNGHIRLSDQWTTKPWNNVIGKINECDTEVKSGKIAIAGCTDYFPEAK